MKTDTKNRNVINNGTLINRFCSLITSYTCCCQRTGGRPKIKTTESIVHEESQSVLVVVVVVVPATNNEKKAANGNLTKNRFLSFATIEHPINNNNNNNKNMNNTDNIVAINRALESILVDSNSCMYYR